MQKDDRRKQVIRIASFWVLGIAVIFGYQNCGPQLPLDDGSAGKATTSSTRTTPVTPYTGDTSTTPYVGTTYPPIAPTATPTATATPGTTQVTTPAYRPIFRVYNSGGNNHLFTMSEQEATNLAGTGWSLEGTPFSVFSNNFNGQLTALYRCWSGNDAEHFLSPAANCERSDITQEGAVGFVSSQPVENAISPLYRCAKSMSDGKTRHIEVLDPRECQNAGYTVEGTLGYVTPPEANVHRVYNASNNDHLFTTNGTEASNLISQGWRDESVRFRLVALAANQNFAPIYRCYIATSGDHFISRYENCETSTAKLEGLMGFVGTAAQGAARVPLYRCVQTGPPFMHHATLDPSECTNAGLTVEATLGFVVPL